MEAEGCGPGESIMKSTSLLPPPDCQQQHQPTYGPVRPPHCHHLQKNAAITTTTTKNTINTNIKSSEEQRKGLVGLCLWGTSTEDAVSVPRWNEGSATAADGVIVREVDIFHLSSFPRKQSGTRAKSGQKRALPPGLGWQCMLDMLRIQHQLTKF